MQPNVEPRTHRQRGCAFGVLHKHHRAGGVDSVRGKARDSAVSSDYAMAKIIGIYAKHKLETQIGDRLVGLLANNQIELLVQQSAVE